MSCAIIMRSIFFSTRIVTWLRPLPLVLLMTLLVLTISSTLTGKLLNPSECDKLDIVCNNNKSCFFGFYKSWTSSETWHAGEVDKKMENQWVWGPYLVVECCLWLCEKSLTFNIDFLASSLTLAHHTTWLQPISSLHHLLFIASTLTLTHTLNPSENLRDWSQTRMKSYDLIHLSSDF